MTHGDELDRRILPGSKALVLPVCSVTVYLGQCIESSLHIFTIYALCIVVLRSVLCCISLYHVLTCTMCHMLRTMCCVLSLGRYWVCGMRIWYHIRYVYIYMHLVSFGGMYSVDTVCTVYDCINCISANEQKAVDGVVNI